MQHLIYDSDQMIFCPGDRVRTNAGVCGVVTGRKQSLISIVSDTGFHFNVLPNVLSRSFKTGDVVTVMVKRWCMLTQRWCMSEAVVRDSASTPFGIEAVKVQLMHDNCHVIVPLHLVTYCCHVRVA